jgi:hypothetical protein
LRYWATARSCCFENWRRGSQISCWKAEA